MSAPCVLIPDPDGPGRVARLVHALRGWDPALGPVVPLPRVGMSLRWARMALGPTARGLIDSHGRLVRYDEHLSTLLIFSDEEVAGVLRAAQLAPLERLRPAQQDRPAETLLAWLQRGCNANEVAVCVHVHPQTVRYRLRQVEDLFGHQLRDPDRPLRAGDRAAGAPDAPAQAALTARALALAAPVPCRPPVPPLPATRTAPAHGQSARRGPLNHLLEQSILMLDHLAVVYRTSRIGAGPATSPKPDRLPEVASRWGLDEK
jgi:DNA-binding CsgD family transcriptional regulator